LVDNNKVYFEIEYHISIANATGTKLNFISPRLLINSLNEMFFLNMSPVKHRGNGGVKI